MSKPPLFPEQSASGIAIDPRTLDRVIPESRRADGTYVRHTNPYISLRIDH
jgi:partner of Y14 and mago